MFDAKRNLIPLKAALEKGGFRRTKAYRLINLGKIEAYKMEGRPWSMPIASTGITNPCHGSYPARPNMWVRKTKYQ
jgi:hypothetical protein